MNSRHSQGSGGIALIGSGELADASAELHRALMGRLGEPVRPLFLDTLAGFESNIDAIDLKASDYFKRNFGLDLALARFRTGQESADQIAEAVSAIGQANYILAGPGSPSYGIRVLHESPVWQAVTARWRAGALVVFASAAAIISGARAIPVYEIFKAGADPAWISGLDLLGSLGLRAAVVPHWNNASGDGYDTRYCYMGGGRFATLERMLDSGELILGLDEYTGLYISPDLRADVLGAGTATIRQAGREAVYARGDCIALADPVPLDAAHPIEQSIPAATPLAQGGLTHDADIRAQRARIEESLAQDDAVAAIEGLVALTLVAGAGLEQSLPGRVDLAVQALQATLPELARFARGAREIETLRHQTRLLVDALITARVALREAQQWAAADRLRNTLSDLGYVVADTPEGTTWSHKGGPEI